MQDILDDLERLCEDVDGYLEDDSDEGNSSEDSCDSEEDSSEEEGVLVWEADSSVSFKDSEKGRTLVEVPRSHIAFEDVQAQFECQWQHTPMPPTIHKVYRVTCSKQHIARFDRYRAEVGRRIGYADGNVIRCWHGTARACRVGDDSSRLTPCSRSDCSLCNVMKWSYDLSWSGKRRSWGRFGSGIYTSSTSSKAYDYVQERGGSRYSALLLNEVVAGNPLCLTDNCSSLKRPPSGYDSVQGVPGTDLNYDECVVYTDAAIRPVYLVLFR
ncbi:uncharacterized protein PHACADRAFT_261065 [Phanerochaete carnosa HHB-10118-sp]|uniref:PARP catalytic domain-containing protein n=1 Tax=Phanerochaete carnosa (strain HHB-10118-sp) TaxID=650164 RepID=K5WQE1_PHACS|nr:uncharacterized protein PHACADRAFT_261065 [Phanerochaete carnosa HHB-10118-sp]EKM52567.1 hypothetical protein PHACADRAFT_261065 [Phanerochaete carnosa HHB-10118-sp]